MASFRLGYVANCLTFGLSASHTCRLANATPARIEQLLALNLAELEQILLFNEAAGIQVFRVGSALVPFGSHPANRTRWWRTFLRDFEHLGRIARRSSQRLSMHPGPEAASLSSIHPLVRRRAVAELRYSTRVLDLLGQDSHARIVLHVGGAAPDPLTALENAHAFLQRLPDELRRRLAVEHDDRVWPARRVLPLATEHGLPFVADVLHNAVLPSDPPLDDGSLLALAAASWLRLGLRPKHHLAAQRSGARPGAHSERVPFRVAASMLAAMRHDADLVLEAKHKDLALLQLRAQLARAGLLETPLPMARERSLAL